MESGPFSGSPRHFLTQGFPGDPRSPKGSAAEGHIAERRRGSSDKRSGDAINGGTPPGVSDIADLPDGVPDKRGGDLLSHPFGQYHRRGRA